MGVTGIGGLFFRAHDPKALAEWYRSHLGIGGEHGLWQQQAGPTVFAPFKADSDYFPADRQWMLNLRVDDLDRLLTVLGEDRGKVEEQAGVGRFARIHDPEGNPIELWQPAPGHR